MVVDIFSVCCGAPAGRIAGQQFRIIRRFREHNALGPHASVELQEIGLRETRILRRMIERGVVVPCENGLYYLSDEQARRHGTRLWLKIWIALGLVAAFLLVWMFFVAT